MTTLFDFQPSATAPYSFQPTLDGQLYTATVLWNLYGLRWYMQLADQSGTVIFYQSLKASEVGQQIAAASWDFNTQQVDITTAAPHGYAVGSVTMLTISGMTPSAYNGLHECFAVGESDLAYTLTSNPGAATAFGVVSFDINMAAGYFQTSTLIYREQNQQFEVSP